MRSALWSCASRQPESRAAVNRFAPRLAYSKRGTLRPMTTSRFSSSRSGSVPHSNTRIPRRQTLPLCHLYTRCIKAQEVAIPRRGVYLDIGSRRSTRSTSWPAKGGSRVACRAEGWPIGAILSRSDVWCAPARGRRPDHRHRTRSVRPLVLWACAANARTSCRHARLTPAPYPSAGSSSECALSAFGSESPTSPPVGYGSGRPGRATLSVH
jgi:hypothetical protein